MCKTQAGAVCLGLSRYVPGPRIICTVPGVIADKTMELIAGNQADFALFEAFILAHFPGASVRQPCCRLDWRISASGTFNIREMAKSFSELNAAAETAIVACSVEWSDQPSRSVPGRLRAAVDMGRSSFQSPVSRLRRL